MAVAPPSSSSLNMFIVGFVFLLVVPHILLHVSCKAGFSDELINRDSLKSHPASTPISRLDSSIRRSASYVDYLRTANPGNANSPLVSINKESGGANPGNGNSPFVSIREIRGGSAEITSYYSHYLVKFRIGSNKHKVSAVLEVADDFTWLFCDPCPTCPADSPIFDPSKSISNYRLHCDDANCKLLEKHNCDDWWKCHFTHKYNLGTANGTLSADTVIISSINKKLNVYLKNAIFGRTNAVEGNHFKDSMGVLGLGSGNLSLISQMSALGVSKKFSYCLPNNNGYSSDLYFGSAFRPRGPVISTSLDSSEPPFHKIKLIEIYVSTGGHIRPTVDNIVISTSIFYTYIGEDSLEFIREQVMQRVNLPQITHEGYKLCYSTTNAPENFKMPEINLIFGENAQLVLEEDNAFVRFDNNVLCLAILSNKLTHGTSVLGSHAQKGNLMLFDIDARMLHFRHKDC